MAPESNGKSTRVSKCAKNVAVLDLREIAPVESIGQINNIGSDRAQKFKKDVSRDQRQINERNCARAKKVAIS